MKHLRNLVLVAAIALGGCGTLQNIYEATTTARVSPAAVYIAGNSFVATELTAKNYLHYCRPVPQPKGCYKEAIAEIIPAVRAARTSYDNLRAFMKRHPDALGAQGLYDALVTTTNTLNDIEAKYGVGK